MAVGYGLQPEDIEDDAYREPTVVNITNEEVAFQIGTTPGARPRRYKLAPYGKHGDRVNLPEGYANEYQGAGTGKMVTPIIERITRREVYPAGPLMHDAAQGKLVPRYTGGPRLPRVVNESRAPRARAAWLSALESFHAVAARKTTTVQLEVSPEDLEPRAARVKASPAKAGPVLDEVGNEPPEPPDEFDVDDDLPVAANSAPPPAIVPAKPPEKGNGKK